MDKKPSDFTLTPYKNNLWIHQILNLIQSDGKFYHADNDRLVPVRFVTLFGIIGEFRHIGEQCILYSVDDGTGLIHCRYNTSAKDVDELEDWDWKDFNVTKNDKQFEETFQERTGVEDSIFNDATVHPEEKLTTRSSRLKALDSLRWSIINSFRSHDALQVGDFVCVHGRVYSYHGIIQIYVNVIRPISMIEELTLLSTKLADCGLELPKERVEELSSSQVTGTKRKRASGLMTFDTIEETQIRLKPRTDIGLPPSPAIVPGSLTFSSCPDSGVTFDTMVQEERDVSSDEDILIPATP